MKTNDPNYPSILDLKLDKLPLTFWIDTPNNLIKKYGLKEVTSHNIYESGSKKFNKDGLFSEEIFGNITDTKRYITMAYINLRTEILQPSIYDTIIKMKRIYKNIISGKVTAKFDKANNDFVICKEDDPDGGSGYSFFIKNFQLKKINPKDYPSLKKQNKMDLLIKYRDDWFTDKLIVMPAGIRDIKEEGGRISQEDINKIYLTILSLSNSFSNKSTDPIYDSIRFNMQEKVYSIYKYIVGLIEKKYGWFQRKYALRRITFGTRNVSSAPLTGGESPNDETIIKYDEAGIPLYQALKTVQPHIIYYLKSVIFSSTFSIDSNKAYLINDKTGALEYVDISLKEIEKFVKYDGLEKIINKFKYADFRNSPISVLGKDGKKYYFSKVYEKSDKKIYIYRTKTELMSYLKIEDESLIDKEKIRYLTWTELLYIVAYKATNDKYAFITRYPAIEDGSIFPAKIQILTTSPSRQIDIVFFNNEIHFPRYPITGEKYIDTFAVHVSRLGALGMDFDGDTGSVTSLMSDDANEELEKYNNSLLSIVDDTFNLKTSGDSENAEYTLYNLTI